MTDLKTDIEGFNGARHSVGLAFVLVPVFMALFYLLASLNLKTGVPPGLSGLFKCFACFPCSPLVPVVLAVMWLVGGINMILCVALSDLCAEDPLAMIVNQVDKDGSKGLSYMIQCTGAPPEAMNTVVSKGAQFAGIVQNIDGMISFMDTDAGCAGVDTTTLKAGLELVGNAFLDTLDALRCKTANKLLTDVLYDQLCGSVVSGAVATWIGVAFVAIGLLGMWLLWKRVQKMKKAEANKIAPEIFEEMAAPGFEDGTAQEMAYIEPPADTYAAPADAYAAPPADQWPTNDAGDGYVAPPPEEAPAQPEEAPAQAGYTDGAPQLPAIN